MKTTHEPTMALSLLLVFSFCTLASADEPVGQDSGGSVLMSQSDSDANSRKSATTFAISESQARSSVQWLAELALRLTPRAFDGDKDWGETKKIWSGVKIRREGFRLRTNRREKDVRHGRWVKYQLTLPEPVPNKPDPMTAKIHRVSRVGGDLQPGVSPEKQTNTHWKIESSIATPMKFTARIQRWNLGVQWYSVTIEGKMRVQLDSTTKLTFLADYAEVPPAFVIDPNVESATLHLEQFEVDRISRIGGDVAEEWGEMMEKLVRDIFLKKQNEKLAGKLNRSIEKHRKDLRLSMADWFAKW